MNDAGDGCAVNEDNQEAMRLVRILSYMGTPYVLSAVFDHLSTLSQPVNSDVLDRLEKWVRDGAVRSSWAGCVRILGIWYVLFWSFVSPSVSSFPLCAIPLLPHLFVLLSSFASLPYVYLSLFISSPIHPSHPSPPFAFVFVLFSSLPSNSLVAICRPFVSSRFVSRPLLIPCICPTSNPRYVI